MAQSGETVSVPIGEITYQMTLRIRGLRGFGIRLRIATWLFRAGARIAGVNIVIES